MSRTKEAKQRKTKTKTKRREGDYYLDCSKDVYFRALPLLTSHRIRHCEEKS